MNLEYDFTTKRTLGFSLTSEERTSMVLDLIEQDYEDKTLMFATDSELIEMHEKSCDPF
jgi:hypothetical protein